MRAGGGGEIRFGAWGERGRGMMAYMPETGEGNSGTGVKVWGG